MLQFAGELSAKGKYSGSFQMSGLSGLLLSYQCQLAAAGAFSADQIQDQHVSSSSSNSRNAQLLYSQLA
jgi:hypothetical protein